MIQVTAICVSGSCEPMRVVFATFMHIVLYSQTSQITFTSTTLTLPFPIGFGTFLFSVLFNHSLASVRIILNSTDLVLPIFIAQTSLCYTSSHLWAVHLLTIVSVHLSCSHAYNCIGPSVHFFPSFCPPLSFICSRLG